MNFFITTDGLYLSAAAKAKLFFLPLFYVKALYSDWNRSNQYHGKKETLKYPETTTAMPIKVAAAPASRNL